MAWPVFPECPSFGFTSRPDYSVTIVERASGMRSVNRNWYYPLHTYSAVPIGERAQEDIHRVLKFWHAIGGQAGRFLFFDYVDYKSSVLIDDDPLPTDQPLVEVTDSPGGWQLFKLYEDDATLYQQLRIIQKPIPGTVRIANSVGAEQPTGTWTLDEDTGILTPGVGFSGTPATWGGEFYTPVMFETAPEFAVTNRRIQQTSFALRELRLPSS
jgi:uncharacterized protein (TIGR02217 family)